MVDTRVGAISYFRDFEAHLFYHKTLTFDVGELPNFQVETFVRIMA